jgi:hypothetical protein
VSIRLGTATPSASRDGPHPDFLSAPPPPRPRAPSPRPPRGRWPCPPPSRSSPAAPAAASSRRGRGRWPAAPPGRSGGSAGGRPSGPGRRPRPSARGRGTPSGALPPITRSARAETGALLTAGPHRFAATRSALRRAWGRRVGVGRSSRYDLEVVRAAGAEVEVAVMRRQHVQPRAGRAGADPKCQQLGGGEVGVGDRRRPGAARRGPRRRRPGAAGGGR